MGAPARGQDSSIGFYLGIAIYLIVPSRELACLPFRRS